MASYALPRLLFLAFYGAGTAQAALRPEGSCDQCRACAGETGLPGSMRSTRARCRRAGRAQSGKAPAIDANPSS